jgi:D-alanine-D-alanine ligase
MPKIRVGVLRGGPSSEYEISLSTGANVLKHLPKEKYEARDILLTKDKLWHLDGFPSTPDKIFKSVDVIFNAMHGEFGEDGQVQNIFDTHAIKYTGSGALSSALAMKKPLSRKIFAKEGLKISRSLLISERDNIEEKSAEIKERLFPWWVIKPAGRGSSVGVTIAKNVGEIASGIKKAFQYDDDVMAEEYISGREATCGVLDNFRGERHYAFPVVEICPPSGKFFDYNVKYNGETKEICPGRFDLDTSKQIQEAALIAHKALGCRHYSRSDFIVSKRGIFILETNTLPGLTSESLLPKAAEAVGLSFPKLLDHIVTLASRD